MGTLLDDMPNLLSVGLAVFAVVQLVVRLPWPQKWLEHKPLSCTVCLSGWGAIAGWCALGERTWSSISFWAAVGGGAMLLDALHGHWKPNWHPPT